MDNRWDTPIDDDEDGELQEQEMINGMELLELVGEPEEWPVQNVADAYSLGHSPFFPEGDIGFGNAETAADDDDSVLSQMMANFEAFTTEGDLLASAMEHYIMPLYEPIMDAIRFAIAGEKLYLAFSKRPINDGHSVVDYTVVMVGTLHGTRPGLLFLLSVVNLDQMGWDREQLFFQTIKQLWPENASVEAAQNILLYLSDDPWDFPSQLIEHMCPKMIGVNGYEKVLEKMKQQFGQVGNPSDDYYYELLCEEIDNAIETIQNHAPLDETLDSILSVYDCLIDWSDAVQEDLYSDNAVTLPDYEALVDICNKIIREDGGAPATLESTAWSEVKFDVDVLSLEEMRHFWFAPLGGISLKKCFPQFDQMLGEDGLTRSSIPFEYIPGYSVVYSNAQLLVAKQTSLIY